MHLEMCLNLIKYKFALNKTKNTEYFKYVLKQLKAIK